MNGGPIRIDPDGLRHYANGKPYRLMADEDRTNTVRKPDDPRAVRFHGNWYFPLDLLDEAERVMPETRGVYVMRSKDPDV